MKKIYIALSILQLLFTSCALNSGSTMLTLSTDAMQIGIDNKGRVVALLDVASGTNYILKDTLAPLLSVRIKNVIKHPKSASTSNDMLKLEFDDNVSATIKIAEKKTHCTFELIEISGDEKVELIIWGPYRTAIQKTIGETVGVVRNDDFAIGIQALNIKTLGGYPWNESDRMPEFDIFKEDNLNDMHPASDGGVLYRVEAAKPIPNGSSLQAYCRNRDFERFYADVEHDKIVAPTYDDGGVIGSKIALFGSAEENTLQTIGSIEIAEGLPHPLIDGEWVKTNPNAASAYLITSFTEATVDDAIALTKKAGLNYLYHYGKTFENWGHFDLYDEEFPNGIEGLKACVDKAAAQGIKMGTHCLSNFVSTNDPYVTPVPDNRLAKVGTSTLVQEIDANATEITIASPEFFNQLKNNNLKTVMIGKELIRYGSVSDQAPWKLLDCQRGAFGTTAMAHPSNAFVAKLLDHAYKVFLTEADLTIEMSKTLASLYNKTGLRQISFDGLEGNRSTGLGTYGESLMPYVWYTNLDEGLKNHLIIDASRTTHFFWHIYSRMNWGEPWYAGFRESQVEYRFNNQAYFKRNFMPGMLGWFKMAPETSIEDIEWMLAKSAGYDAGYALVADLEAVKENGNAEKILALIGDWEKLRLSNAFTEGQKEMMRDNKREFSIAKINDRQWNWQEVYSRIFTHEKKVRQPGEPLHSNFKFNNLEAEQVANFTLTANGCDVSEISFEINGYKKIVFTTPLKEGQRLKYTGGDKAFLLDANWQVIGEIALDPADLKIKQGENLIAVDCSFDRANKEANLKVEFRTQGKDEKVSLEE